MGTYVLITRPDGPYAGARNLHDALVEAGFQPSLFRVLECARVKLSSDDQRIITQVITKPGQWLVFLSPTAVTVFRDLIKEDLAGAQLSPGVKIAVQGKGSSEVVRSCFGREADFVPSVFVAEHFAEEFSQRLSKEAPVLVAQSSEGRNVFARILQSRGFTVETVETYTTRSCQPSVDEIKRVVQLARSGAPVYLLFMSPSAVTATVSALSGERDILQALRIVSVGPITSQAVRKNGLTVAAEAIEHSEAGIVRALQGLASA